MDEFEVSLVVDWYLELEGRLLDVLKTTLFTDEIRNIFMPPLANILLDASSLIDAIFREQYSGTKERQSLRIVDFAAEFEPRIHFSRRRSLLLQTPLKYIEPFREWYDTTTATYKPLEWWQGYNKLKHDRIKEYKVATLDNAIHSLCGLHQVMALLEVFKNGLLRRDLISFGTWAERYALDRAYSRSDHNVTILVETELFATPVGVLSFPDDIGAIRPHQFSDGKKLWKFVGPDI
jgi:hypothetical protein